MLPELPAAAGRSAADGSSCRLGESQTSASRRTPLRERLSRHQCSTPRPIVSSPLGVHRLDRRLNQIERSIAQRLAQNHRRPGRLPDGILSTEAGNVAIEVELTLKSGVRLQAIIDDLSLAYDQVRHFAPGRLLPTLTELAAAAPFGNVTVRRYPPLPAEVAAAAADLTLNAC